MTWREIGLQPFIRTNWCKSNVRITHTAARTVRQRKLISVCARDAVVRAFDEYVAYKQQTNNCSCDYIPNDDFSANSSNSTYFLLNYVCLKKHLPRTGCRLGDY